MDNDLTTPAAQVRRLEALYTAMETELQNPSILERLRHPASENEWSAMQTLGHIVEMIPYWMRDCERIIAADTPPQFGRGIDAPERLEGVEHGASQNPNELLGQLKGITTAAAADILAMSPADLEKQGIHIRRGPTTVAEIIQIFVVNHAEDHLEQARKALRA